MPWQNSESSPVFRSLLLLGVVAGFFSCLPQGFADTSRKSPATAPVSSSRNSGIPENIPEAGKDAAINGARTQEVDSSFSRPSFSCDVALGATLTTSTISASQAAAMQTYSMTQSIGLGFVGGVFLGYEATPEWEFEVGLQFSRRRIDYSLNAVLVGSEHVEFSYLELPAILRYRFSPNFSAGGGVYYAQGLGGVSIVSNTPGVPSSTNTSATKNDDFGFVINSRLNFPVDPSVHAFLDARFLFGILNVNSPSATEGNTYFRELEILAGMSFGI